MAAAEEVYHMSDDDDEEYVPQSTAKSTAKSKVRLSKTVSTRGTSKGTLRKHIQEDGIHVVNTLIEYIKSVGGIGMIIGSIAYNDFMSNNFGVSVDSNNSTVDALFLSPFIGASYTSYEDSVRSHIVHMMEHTEKFKKILSPRYKLKIEDRTRRQIVNSYIFPGLYIRIYDASDTLLSEISYEVSSKLDIDKFQLFAVNPLNNCVNWVGWVITSFFSIHADDIYKSKFDKFIFFLDSISNSGYKYVSTLLSIIQVIFKDCSILEYRYKADHLFQYMLQLLDVRITITHPTLPVENVTYKQFESSVQDKVLDYGHMDIPQSSPPHSMQRVTLRNLINHCINVVNMAVSPNAVLSKSGGEVYRYYGNYASSSETKDIDTKLFLVPGIPEENKMEVFRTVITIVLMYVSIISQFNFMTSYINVVTSDNTINMEGTIMNEDFRLDIRPFVTHERQRDVSLRSIKVSDIKLLSIDVVARTTFTFRETRIQIDGKIISSPLDIALDKSPYSSDNVISTPEGINILTPQYLIKDIKKILKDPIRISKKQKDLARLEFISDPSNQIINPHSSAMLNVGYNYDIFNRNIQRTSPSTIQIYPDLAFGQTFHDLYDNYYVQIIQSFLSPTERFKTPLYYDVHPDETANETEVFGGGKKRTGTSNKRTKKIKKRYTRKNKKKYTRKNKKIRIKDVGNLNKYI